MKIQYQLLTVITILLLQACATTSSTVAKKHQILTLDDVKANNFEIVPDGYTAKFQQTTFSGDKYYVEFKFKGSQDGGSLFRKYYDGKLDLDNVFLLKNGRIFYSYKGGALSPLDSYENCDTFFIGECTTQSNKIRTRTYADKTWKYNYRGTGLTNITISTVYDKFGLILTQENKNVNIARPSANASRFIKRIK
jgi:hypothetical protein